MSFQVPRDHSMQLQSEDIGNTKAWITSYSPRTSHFSHSFVKGEYILGLNYTCDCVPSEPLTCTNVKHTNLKRGNGKQDGGHGAPATAITWHWSLFLHYCPDPTASETQLPSLPKLTPTEARVTQESPPSPLLTHVHCPLSRQPQLLKLPPGTQAWCSLWMPGHPDSVLLSHLNEKISPFFLFVACSPTLRSSPDKGKLFSFFRRRCTTINCIIYRRQGRRGKEKGANNAVGLPLTSGFDPWKKWVLTHICQ